MSLAVSGWYGSHRLSGAHTGRVSLAASSLGRDRSLPSGLMARSLGGKRRSRREAGGGHVGVGVRLGLAVAVAVASSLVTPPRTPPENGLRVVTAGATNESRPPAQSAR